MRILPLLLLLTIGCAAPSQPATTPTPRPPTAVPTPRPATATPQPPAPTATARPATPTPGHDYKAMRNKLVNPLSSMIVSVRDNDRPMAAAFLAEFNRAGDEILPQIEGDLSRNANVLHSAITNVRATPGDLSVLNSTREHLLFDIT